MTAPATTFDAFCRAEQAMLLRYFRKHVGRDAAPDLVQDAFMRMLRSGAFDRIDYPRPYLLRTARNLVVERARRKAREGATCPFDETCDAAHLVMGGRDPAVAFLNTENVELGGRPLAVATASAEGYEQVAAAIRAWESGPLPK